MKLNRKARGEDGASLVEFAIIAPLLIALLFGIIEFGWGLSQQLDIRHKARETLRLAIVDAPEADIIARVCANDLIRADSVTLIERTGGNAPGDQIVVTVTADMVEITGLFSIFWGADPEVSSTVEGRVEQEATDWLSGEDLAPCP